MLIVTNVRTKVTGHMHVASWTSWISKGLATPIDTPLGKLIYE